jgi:glutathione S-transferase
MSAPVLFSFRRCPYAIRARLALRQAGIAWELREVVLRAKPAVLLALSPKGTVPVMRLPNGQVLEESLDIMRWALAQHDPEGWLTLAPADAMRALIETNDLCFKPLLDRYKYPERYPDHTRASYRDQAIDCMLADLDRTLRVSPHLLGDRPCLADMAIVPFVRQFAQVDRAWWDGCELSALRQWLAALTGSALFEAVMAKAPGHKTEQASR